MKVGKPSGDAAWTDPDDAPLITDAFFDQDEVFRGDQFMRKGRGRPESDAPKERINIRLDVDVVARLRASGPGWQTRAAAILRKAVLG